MVTPYVNCVLLQQFINKQVRVVGEVVKAETGRVTLRTSDNGTIVIKTEPGSMNYSRIVEFTGNWTSNGALEEISHQNYSDNFNLKTHNRLLGLMHGPFRHLFYQADV